MRMLARSPGTRRLPCVTGKRRPSSRRIRRRGKFTCALHLGLDAEKIEATSGGVNRRSQANPANKRESDNTAQLRANGLDNSSSVVVLSSFHQRTGSAAAPELDFLGSHPCSSLRCRMHARTLHNQAVFPALNF